MTKCIVKNCQNHTDQGQFVGEVCKPCHIGLLDGSIQRQPAAAAQTALHVAMQGMLNAWQALPPAFGKPSFDIWVQQQLDNAVNAPVTAGEEDSQQAITQEALKDAARRGAEQISALTGERFEIVPFRELPAYHQTAVILYKAVQTHGWDIAQLEAEMEGMGVEGYAGIKQALPKVREHYVGRYGETLWGVPRCLTAAQVRRAMFNNSDLAARFQSFEEYLEWVRDENPSLKPYAGDEHSRMAVVLSCSDGGYIVSRDWNRLLSYLLAGHETIPAVFVPETPHLERLV